MKYLFLFSISLLLSVSSFAQETKDKKTAIPQVVYSPNKDYEMLYKKAWELALDHIKYQDELPQSPYVDEAFDDGTIWIWDTDFMLLFYKYAQTPFPTILTLNNFYQPIHDEVKIPLRIEILDNPPLFAWTEYKYHQFSNDQHHLDLLLNKNEYLQRHFEWFDTVSQGTIMANSAPTCIKKEEKGYVWEGGRSGMDNTPRGRKGEHALKHRPNNPDMLWIDAIGQQGLSALYIARLMKSQENEEGYKKWMLKYETLKALVNQYYWDAEDGFYYDIDRRDLSFMKVKTPASYWPMLAEMCSAEQAKKMAQHLEDEQWFGGALPWTTVSRDDADFDPLGGYWRGSVWLPTAYMGIKALEKYEYFDLARKNALQIIDHMLETYQQYSPHTIWECYNPNEPMPATTITGTEVRPDFCGWSALGPISLLIENVIGIYEVDAANNLVKWNLTKEDRQGVKDFCFGDIKTDIIYQNNKVEVKTNKAFTLEINGKSHQLKKGKNRIDI